MGPREVISAEPLRTTGKAGQCLQCAETGGDGPREGRSLLLKPRAAELIEKGNQAFDAGDLSSAEAFFLQATAADGELPAAWFNLGNTLVCQRRHGEAIESYSRARSLAPHHHSILHNLGVALAAVRRFDESVQLLTEAVELFPSSADYLNSLGNAHAGAGDHDRAIACYRSALRLAPGSAQIHYNAGEELLKLWRLEEAVVSYRRSIELDSSFIPAYHNLGYALKCDRRVEEAVEVFERGLALAPDDVELRWNLAQALLLKGEYSRGWLLYEERWQTGQFRERIRRFPFPQWDGSPSSGKTILVYTEQGFGDSLQFIRYAELLASSGARVVVECPPELLRLFRSVRGVSRVIPTGAPPGPCDMVCALMSLPALLGTTLDTIPAVVPYLDVDVPLLEQWRRRVEGQHSGFRVGIVWGGRTQQWNEKHRALSLRDLLPLGEVPGISLFSLQMGEAASELGELHSSLPITDLTGEIRDFADTAALILNLDCMIGIDTAVVHLAGALGKPTWTLLPYAADWRWLLGRGDSPWYPTMRLFRQRSAGGWTPVISEVCEHLRGMFRNGGAVSVRTCPVSPTEAALIDDATRQHREGDLAGALSGYLRAVEQGVESPVLFSNIGLLFAQAGRSDEAAQWLDRAIEMDPDNVAALNGLGMYLLGHNMTAHARRTFQRALREAPGNAALLNNIGITLGECRDTGGELAWFRSAIRADRSLVDAHWNLAQAALSAGLLEEGWREYEWRWSKPDFTSPKPDLTRPVWDGTPLDGRSLLIHAEQGFGDTIQFCRYLTHPRLGGGDLVFQVQPPLLNLMRGTFSRSRVIAWGEPVPQTDLHVPLMSLPRLVGTTLDNIPCHTPYLEPPPPEQKNAWSGRIVRPAGGLAAGLVWHGRPAHRQDRTRSLRLSRLTELLGIEHVSWYSLQVGDSLRELEGSTEARNVVHDLSGMLKDFSDTAAAILHLDLVIAVDTAVAHLAGALGKQVWVLLSSPADWRWLRSRSDSPWYPSMTLVRQHAAGDWTGAIRQVASMLRERAARPVGGRGRLA